MLYFSGYAASSTLYRSCSWDSLFNAGLINDAHITAMEVFFQHLAEGSGKQGVVIAPNPDGAAAAPFAGKSRQISVME